MSAPLITLDSHGTIERARATLGRMPAGTERARRRALRQTLTWIKRQVLRAAAAGAEIPQKQFAALLRFHSGQRPDGGVSIWVGTNPIAAHRLGTVVWAPYRGAGSRPRGRPKTPGKGTGARVGRRVFPGSWSWGPGSRTGTAVMQRLGAERLPIERVNVPVHERIQARIGALQPAINDFFEKKLLQQLRYQLHLEDERAGAA